MDEHEHYLDALQNHYESIWRAHGVRRQHLSGPLVHRDLGLHVLEFAPAGELSMWTYATLGMSRIADHEKLEVHLFSPKPSDALVELVAIVAWFHRTKAQLGLGHTVNFGRPWIFGSACDHGLISLPYLHGPKLETFKSNHGQIDCFWLIPITQSERNFKRDNGLEALEQRFEQTGFDYLDPERGAVV